MPRSRMHVDPDLKDAARRASDAINAFYSDHAWFDLRNKFVAISLADGSCDGVLYDSKPDAVRHQKFEQQCAYVCFRNLGPSGSKPSELAVFLQMNRNAYKSGARLTDPDLVHGGPDIAPTSQRVDMMRDIVSPLFQVDPMAEFKAGIEDFMKNIGMSDDQKAQARRAYGIEK